MSMILIGLSNFCDNSVRSIMNHDHIMNVECTLKTYVMRPKNAGCFIEITKVNSIANVSKLVT